LLRIITPKWYFPTLLIIILLLLTAFRISGSSIGPFYDYYFTGKSSSALLAGNARGVRTDEWLVTTQLTIAQERAGYPRFNHTIGEGKDMSLITDVPYKEWSISFKPQNLAFFALPFENAFAFKWWFLLVALMLSIYCLALRFLTGKHRYLNAALISIIGTLNPFVFWWYQSVTILSMAWSFVIILLCMRILDRLPLSWLHGKRKLLWSQIILGGALAYSMVAFAFLLYPAFQVPLAITFSLLLLGYLLNLVWDQHVPWSKLKSSLLVMVSALVVAGTILGAFVFTRLDAIHSITHTVYPGARSIASGGVEPQQLSNFIGFNQYELLDDNIQSSVPGNQSEASTFLVLSIVFILPLVWFSYWHYRKSRKIDWVVIGILLANVILLAHMFVPLFSPLAKLLLLSAVPQIRLYIAFGFLGTLSVLYTVFLAQKYPAAFSFKRHAPVYLYGILLFGGNLALALLLKRYYPNYFLIGHKFLLALLAYTVGLSLLLTKRAVYGLVLLSLLSLALIYKVQPLYQGLGLAYNGPVTQEIDRLSQKDAVWGTNGSYIIENLPSAAGEQSITGTEFYPDLSFWHHVDNGRSQAIYNRYAHVMLTTSQTAQLHLVQADFFTAKLQCGNYVESHVTNVLSTEPVRLSCYRLSDTIKSSQVGTIYFYTRN